jgi:Flagellar hook-length control protein FliK
MLKPVAIPLAGNDRAPRSPIHRIEDHRGAKTFAGLVDGKEKRPRQSPQIGEDGEAPDEAPSADAGRGRRSLAALEYPLPAKSRRREDDSEVCDRAETGESETPAAFPLVGEPPRHPRERPPGMGADSEKQPLDGRPSRAPGIAASLATPVDGTRPADRASRNSGEGREDVKIVSRQTFPAPVPNERMPGGIRHAADRTEAGADAGPAISWTVAASAPQSELRILKIKLHPDHLGELTVSLKLRGAELAVNIEAHSGAAIEAIKKDESMLHQALRSAGYDTAALTVVLAPAPKDLLSLLPADGSGGLPQSALTGGNGSGGDAPRSGNGERGSHFTNRDEDWRDSDDPAHALAFVPRRVDGVYL